MTALPDALRPPRAGIARRLSRRGLIVTFGAVIAVLLAATSMVVRTLDAPEMPVVRVVRKDLSSWITSNGKVEPIEPHQIVAQLDSFVREVLVSEGTTVSAGQLLLTLDQNDLQAQLARAREAALAAGEQRRIAGAGVNGEEMARVEGDLQRTDAELAKLGRDRESLQRLVATRAATPDELEQTTLAIERAEAERQFLVRKRAAIGERSGVDVRRATLLAEQAGQTIRALEEQLQSTRVVAPAAGTVYRLPVVAGQHVRLGDSLADVADLRHVRVRAFIDEPDLGSMAVGQQVLITWDALTGRSWTGSTTQIPASVAARGGRTVGDVLCSVDNSDMTLLPNINVDVRVRLKERPHVVTVPRAAVHSAASGRYVFLVKDRRLQRLPITVGIASTSDFEVIDGLSEGDLVALPGDTEPRDGMTIKSGSR